MGGSHGNNQLLDGKLSDWQVLQTEVTECRLCPRLVAWREEVARSRRRAYQTEAYWGRPVPGFGDFDARVWVVGLAPAAHGGNRTGRVFTGDSSGDFLYGALYRAGFANQPISKSRGDGLFLTDIYISAVCRCAPPDNKPTPGEIATCQPFLAREFALLDRLQVVVALGRIAFDGIWRLLKAQKPDLAGPPGTTMAKPGFAHSAVYRLDGLPTLVASYHPSRQNTQTGRLTPAMFDEVWNEVRALLAG
jgi:uracil-DNA glycosylase